MADENPTGRGSAVALSIPADQVRFLRGLFSSARAGVRQELKEYPKQLKEPARLHREDAAYGRLLAALDELVIVPDDDVRDVLGDLAQIIDAATSTAASSPSTKRCMACSTSSREVRADDRHRRRCFGDNLARHRKRADLSQEELSRPASLHRTEISQLERGLNVLPVSTPWSSCSSPSKSPPDDLLEGIAGPRATTARWIHGPERRLMAEGIRKRHTKDCPARDGRAVSMRRGDSKPLSTLAVTTRRSARRSERIRSEVVARGGQAVPGPRHPARPGAKNDPRSGGSLARRCGTGRDTQPLWPPFQALLTARLPAVFHRPSRPRCGARQGERAHHVGPPEAC